MYLTTSGEAEMSTLACKLHPNAEGCQPDDGSGSLNLSLLTWAMMIGAGFVIWNTYKRR